MQRTVIMFFVLLFTTMCAAQNEPGTPSDSASPPPPSHPEAARRRPGVAGTITALDDKTITLKTLRGAAATVTLTDKTQFRKDRQQAKLSDFKVGDMIMVRGDSSGENIWTAELVASRTGGGEQFREGMGKRFIAGEVKAIDGTHLTIARFDGVSQIINVDENTSFKKQGESITLADLHPGDHVMGRDEVKDGIFVPSTLVVGDEMLMQMPMGGPSPKAGPDAH